MRMFIANTYFLQLSVSYVLHITFFYFFYFHITFRAKYLYINY